jgi:hypothetical protein
MEELAARSGVPLRTLYAVKSGERNPGPRVINGLLKAFADLPYERLFMPSNSANASRINAIVEEVEAR